MPELPSLRLALRGRRSTHLLNTFDEPLPHCHSQWCLGGTAGRVKYGVIVGLARGGRGAAEAGAASVCGARGHERDEKTD